MAGYTQADLQEHNELLLLRDFREAHIALDLIEADPLVDPAVLVEVRRIARRAGRAVTYFYATNICERADLSKLRE